MANVKNNAATQETKRKLVDAAGVVFAEKGFERATIREITALADASMAAVNYHFQDKHELYYEVVRQAHSACLGAMKVLEEPTAVGCPERKLYAFVRALLTQTLDPNRPAWHGVILSQEIQNPSRATEEQVQSMLAQYFVHMHALITTLAQRPLSEREVRLIVNSVVSQCIFYVEHRAMHAKMFPQDPPASECIDELAAHITCFSLAGIRSSMARCATATHAREAGFGQSPDDVAKN